MDAVETHRLVSGTIVQTLVKKAWQNRCEVAIYTVAFFQLSNHVAWLTS